MTSKKISSMQKTIAILHKIEDGILISLLLIMIVMAVLQIFLRNLFDSGILWADPLVRILVLWIGLIGAMVASRKNHHISIDVISKYLPGHFRKLTSVLIFIFTAVVCAIMTFFSLSFVIAEKHAGMIAFASIPAWICELIIPVSFAVICLRYILFSFSAFGKLFRRARQ